MKLSKKGASALVFIFVCFVALFLFYFYKKQKQYQKFYSTQQEARITSDAFVIEKEGSLVDVNGFLEADFDEAMGASIPREYKLYFEKPQGKSQYDFFKKLYNQNKPSVISTSSVNKIPKIIHQIWLGTGDKSPPVKYVFYQETIKKLHQQWKYILWTEDMIQAENFPDIDLYNTTRTYTEKADIARYMILKKYGGLYIDMDTYCLKSFDPIIDLYEFFVGIEPNNSTGYPHLINALIATSPNHQVINKTLAEIRKGWMDSEVKYENGALRGRDIFWLVQTRTFLPFDRAFKESITIDNKSIIAFPAAYFYPIYFDKQFFSKVREYSISYHDFGKIETNVRYLDFSLWAKTFGSKRLANQTELENYRSVFEKRFPNKVLYKVQNSIPNNFYLLGENIKIWQNYYLTADITQLNIDEVTADKTLIYNELFELVSDADERELLAKLIVLYNKGGLFIGPNTYPIQNNMNQYLQVLFELNNKYDFYGFIDINEGGVRVSPRLFAGAAKNYLIEKVLESIKKSRDGKVFDSFNRNIYKYMYLGNNILFPNTYFIKNE